MQGSLFACAASCLNVLLSSGTKFCIDLYIYPSNRGSFFFFYRLNSIEHITFPCGTCQRCICSVQALWYRLVTFLQDPENGWLDDSPDPLPHCAMLLVKQGLHCYVSCIERYSEVKVYADSNVRQLLLCALGCLFSEEQRTQQMALKGILPVIEDCAKSLGPELSGLTKQAIWMCARFLPSTCWPDSSFLLCFNLVYGGSTGHGGKCLGLSSL